MASSKSGVAQVTGDATAVQPQHGEKSTASSMSIGTTEPVEIIDITGECFFFIRHAPSMCKHVSITITPG